MSLDDFLGVYYIEDYHYWLALIAAIVITFYMGFDDEDDKNKYSIGERIFNFFGFSIFLSMFTWFGLFILAGILSLPISYIQKDLLNYETQNEINKKWVSAAKDLEDWCIGKKEIKRRSLTGDYIDQNVDNRLEVCLTQRDYRLSKVDKLTFFQKIFNSHISLISLILAELCPIVGQKTFCTVSRWWPSVENLLTVDCSHFLPC